MKIEELEVLINANADQFRREVADVNSKLGTLNKTTTGVSGAIGGNLFGSMMKANIASQVLIGVAKKVGSAIFNVGSKVVNLGTQYTRLKVATDTVTRNMGMSRGEVDKLRSSLEEANTYGSQAENVIKTLALSGLVDMADGLKAVDARTGDTVQGIEALVLTMKDLGASAGIDSAQAIEKLTKFVRRGEVAFADGVIEIGNINQAYNAYSRVLGKSVIDLTAEERARVRLNIVMEEGAKAFGTYANTMQTAGKAIDSTKNAITSIFERVGNYLEPLFASVARAVFLFVEGIRSSLIGNAQAFKDWASKVASYVIVIVRILGGLLSRIPIIGKNFVALKDFALKPVVATMSNLEENTTGVGGAMDNTTKSAKALKKELVGLAGFDEMNVLKPPSEDGSGGTGGVSGVNAGGMDFGELIKSEDLNQNVEKINGMVEEIEGKFRNLGERIRGIFNGLFTSDMFITMARMWETVWGDIGVGIDKWSPIIKWKSIDLITSIYEDAFVPRMELIKTIWGDTWKNLSNTWDLYGSEIIDGIGEFLSNMLTTFQGLWDNILKPIFEPALNMLKDVWKDTLEPMQKSFFGFVGKLISGALEIRDEVFFPIIDWIVLFLKPVFEGLGKGISEVVGIILRSLGGFLDGVFTYLGGVIDFIVGVFTGNWAKAWGGVINVFIGIWGAISSAFKLSINLLINGINSFLSGLNRIKIPDWVPAVGGKGFNIKPIPYLAEGGVVGSPTLAMIGEAGREVVMPLENNTGWIQELADKIGNRSGNMNLVVKIGEDTIFEKAVDYINDRSLSTGMTVLNI